MLTKLKSKVQSSLAVEARWAYKIGLTPNGISVIGVFFATLSGLSYGFVYKSGQLQLFLATAPILLLISGFCDALDGVMARIYNLTTEFGGFFDSLLDRYSDAVIFIGIILGGLCHPFWGLTALTGSLLVSYTRARAETLGVKMESIGIAERAERLLILIFSSFLSIIWPPSLYWGVISLALLTKITVIQRTLHFYKASRLEKTAN